MEKSLYAFACWNAWSGSPWISEALYAFACCNDSHFLHGLPRFVCLCGLQELWKICMSLWPAKFVFASTFVCLCGLLEGVGDKMVRFAAIKVVGTAGQWRCEDVVYREESIRFCIFLIWGFWHDSGFLLRNLSWGQNGSICSNKNGRDGWSMTLWRCSLPGRKHTFLYIFDMGVLAW